MQQLRDCLAYYKTKTHPSSMISEDKIAADLGPDWKRKRWPELQRWFEKLPMYLLEEPKRQKVVKALTDALRLAERGKL